MGTRLVEPDANNPRGYFEDRDFLALNRRLMLASTDDAPGHRDSGWTETEHWEEGPAAGVRTAARDLLAARREGRRWGWKDPRTTLVLDFWDGLAAEPARNPFYEQYRGVASGTSGSSCAVTASAAASISPATWSRPDGGDLPVDSWSR